MNKKRFIKHTCFLVILCCVAIGAYSVGKFSVSNIKQKTFYASIISLCDKCFIVQGLEVNDINTRGYFKFTTDDTTIFEWHNTKIQINDLQVGDTISITYLSDIKESEPARIKNIIRIVLLDDEK